MLLGFQLVELRHNFDARSRTSERASKIEAVLLRPLSAAFCSFFSIIFFRSLFHPTPAHG